MQARTEHRERSVERARAHTVVSDVPCSGSTLAHSVSVALVRLCRPCSPLPGRSPLASGRSARDCDGAGGNTGAMGATVALCREAV